MSIDLGNNPVGTPPTTAEQAQIRSAINAAEAGNYQVEPSEGPFVDGDKTKLDNAIESDLTGEPTGSDQILNVVSLTQAEYDAGTPVSTTLYIING